MPILVSRLFLLVLWIAANLVCFADPNAVEKSDPANLRVAAVVTHRGNDRIIFKFFIRNRGEYPITVPTGGLNFSVRQKGHQDKPTIFVHCRFKEEWGRPMIASREQMLPVTLVKGEISQVVLELLAHPGDLPEGTAVAYEVDKVVAERYGFWTGYAVGTLTDFANARAFVRDFLETEIHDSK